MPLRIDVILLISNNAFDLLFDSFIVRTDPADVARVESKTIICTEQREDTIPTPAPGVKGTLGQWEEPEKMKKQLYEDRFPGCMKGMK